MATEGFTQVTMDNADKANAAVASLLNEVENADVVPARAFPSPPAPGGTGGALPAGVSDAQGNILRDVTVRELTGRDEEKIAKAKASGNSYRWINAILLAGTESINGQPATLDLLDRMLLGDREYLMTQIRIATFGAEVELGDWNCPECRETFEATVNVGDVVNHPLKNDERHITVPLWKGGEAIVRVPVGSDQAAFLTGDDLTLSERNTTLLMRVVEAIKKDGVVTPTAGFPSLVANLGLKDRTSILEAIAESQPGPRYDEVEIKHSCGAAISAPLGLVSLFPGL